MISDSQDKHELRSKLGTIAAAFLLLKDADGVVLLQSELFWGLVFVSEFSIEMCIKITSGRKLRKPGFRETSYKCSQCLKKKAQIKT